MLCPGIPGKKRINLFSLCPVTSAGCGLSESEPGSPACLSSEGPRVTGAPGFRFMNLVGMQLICTIVLLSGMQQSDSFVQLHMHIY